MRLSPVSMLLAAIFFSGSIVHGQPALYPELTLPGPLLFEEEEVEPDPEDILVEVNPETLDLLIETSREKDPAVRSRVAWALGDIGDPEAITYLRKAVKDPVPEVRR